MAKKLKTYPYDSADFLKSEVDIGYYMAEVLKSDDPAYIAYGLGTVARARGMSKVAKKAGLSRESLYKALGPEGNPELGTVLKVMKALGLKLSVKAAH
jgi:probable addiction module antidote protein